MKKRWVISALVLAICMIGILPQLASDLHFFLAKEYESFIYTPADGWKVILQGGNPLKLFGILSGAVALILSWILFTSTYLNYRSSMHEVTPDIYTPCADGQGQFGTARWMNPNQISKHFGVWKIARKSSKLQQLLKAGQKDQEEIKNADVPLD